MAGKLIFLGKMMPILSKLIAEFFARLAANELDQELTGLEDSDV